MSTLTKEQEDRYQFWRRFDRYVSHTDIFGIFFTCCGVVGIIACIVIVLNSLDHCVSSSKEWKANILRVDSPRYENTLILAIDENKSYSSANVPIPVGIEDGSDRQFDEDFVALEWVGFIGAACFSMCILYCMLRCIALTNKLQYRNNCDDREDRLRVIGFMALWIVLESTCIWCSLMHMDLDTKGHQIYNEAIKAIPLDFDKDKYTDATLSEKYNLVNSYLIRMSEKGEPQAYSVKKKKYIPFDANVKWSKRPLTEIDEILDSQQKDI